MKLKVKYIPCLFDKSTWIEFQSHNETIFAIFSSLFQQHPEIREDPPGIIIRVNGKILSLIEWKKPLNDGDEVLIIQEIGAEYIVSILGAIGISVSISTVSTILTVVSVAYTIASIAYAIYSYATAPKSPKNYPQSQGSTLADSPTYGWDGITMQSRQGVPVGTVYGEHLVGGNLIEAYITSVFDKNYLHMLIALSEGEIEGIMKEDLSGVCTLAHNIFSVGTITFGAGIPTENQIFTIGTQVFTWKTTLTVPTPTYTWFAWSDPAIVGQPVIGWGEVLLGANASACCDNMVYAINTCSSLVRAVRGTGNTVVVTSIYPGTYGNGIIFTEASSNMAMDGSGYLGGTTAGVNGDIPYILINDNPLSNFQNVSWDYRLGTQNQTQIPGFGDISQTYSMGNLKISTTPYIYTTVDDDVQGVDMAFRCPALYRTQNNNYLEGQAIALIDWKLHSSGTWITGDWIVINGTSQNPVRRIWKKGDLTPGQYDFRITLFSPAPNPPYSVGDLYLDNVIEIKYDTLIYPHTALLAVDILATEQISGTIPNVLTRIRGIKTENLDTSVTEWTRNPIYNVNDLLVNPRYGVGKYISQSNINNDQLILMANHCNEILGDGIQNTGDSSTSTSFTDSDYTFVAGDIGKYICCKSSADTTVYTNLLITSLTGDHTVNGTGGWSFGTLSTYVWEFGEKRYELDLVIDSKNAAFSCINQICGSFRGLPIWNKDAIQLFIEKKENPSYIFNMGNIIDGSFKHTFGSEKSKPNCIQIDYADKDKKFQKETVDVTDYLAITGGVPMRTRQMSLLGASRQSQIYREGRFHLNAAKYQDEQITFKGAIDAIHMLPGDVTKFQHDVFRWGQGGRIVSATTTAITLDQPFTIISGSYSITCKLVDDTLETKVISDGPGTYTTVHCTAFTSAPPVFGLYAIGVTGLESKLFRIMSVTKTPENEIEVSATEYDANVYVDTEIVIVPSLTSTLPPESQWPIPPPVPPISTVPPPEVTGFSVTETSIITGVSITFTLPTSLSNWTKANIYISSDGGTNYTFLGTMYDEGPLIYRDVLAGGTYYFKVVSLSPTNIESVSPPITYLTIYGTSAASITGLTVTPGFLSNRLDWTSSVDSQTNLTEIWRADSDDRGVAVLIASVYGTSYTDQMTLYVAASGTKYYWIRNKNPNGGYSAWYPPPA